MDQKKGPVKGFQTEVVSPQTTVEWQTSGWKKNGRRELRTAAVGVWDVGLNWDFGGSLNGLRASR